MSRSRRYTPICGITTSESEKRDKRLYNRRYRRVTEQIVRKLGSELEFLPQLREYSNPWAMDKDGKCRFDSVRHPGLMRK